MHGVVRDREEEGPFVFGSFLKEINRASCETKNSLGVVIRNGSLGLRLPPIAVGIAVRVSVIEVGDIISMILKPPHGCAALAEKSSHVILVRSLNHFCNRQVLAHVDLALVHHNIVDRNTPDTRGSHSELNTRTRWRAHRRWRIGT